MTAGVPGVVKETELSGSTVKVGAKLLLQPHDIASVAAPLLDGAGAEIAYGVSVTAPCSAITIDWEIARFLVEEQRVTG